MFKSGDRVKVRGIVRYEGTVDTIESAPSGKPIVMVDLDNGMTMPCFVEELKLIDSTEVKMTTNLIYGVIVTPSAFHGVYNLATPEGRGFGHVMNRHPLVDDWTGYLWETGHDEYQGTWAELDAAIRAMSVLAPE